MSSTMMLVAVSSSFGVDINNLIKLYHRITTHTVGTNMSSIYTCQENGSINYK